MKSHLATIFILLFCISYGFGQFSIGTGLTTPITSIQNLDFSSGDVGHQFIASYDKSLNDCYGLSTGVLVRLNPIKENSTNYIDGAWSYASLGIGLFVKPLDNLKIKGLFTRGMNGTPTIQGETGTFTLADLSNGLDFRIEYSIKKFYIGTNFLYSNPKFQLPDGNPLEIEEHSITTLGFLGGYNF